MSLKQYKVNTLKLKSRIVELAITQDVVADYLGLDRATFNLKINNKRRMYVDEMIKLANILKIDNINMLFEYFSLEFDFIVLNSCENATDNTKED